MVLVVFIATTYLTLQLLNKGQAFDQISLGKTQIALLQVQQEADKAIIFVDQAAKLASFQAFGELVKNGGFFDPSDREKACGSIKIENNEYIFWGSYDDKVCFPDVFSEFSKSFSPKFDKLIKLKFSDFPSNTFDYFFDENKFAGVSYALLPIQIIPSDASGFDNWFVKANSIWKQGNVLGLYYVKPFFDLSFEPGLFMLSEVKNILAEMTRCYKPGEEARIEQCIKGAENNIKSKVREVAIKESVVKDLNVLLVDMTLKNPFAYTIDHLILHIAIIKPKLAISTE